MIVLVVGLIALPEVMLRKQGEYSGAATVIRNLLLIVIFLAGTVSEICVSVRRLRDLGRPGSHYFLLMIPFYNSYLGLIMMFRKGTDGPNEYGEDPLAGKVRHCDAAGGRRRCVLGPSID